MYTATKILFLAGFIALASWETKTEVQDFQKDDEILYSQVDPRFHDKTCMCGYCTEGDYQMEVAYDSAPLLANPCWWLVPFNNELNFKYVK